MIRLRRSCCCSSSSSIVLFIWSLILLPAQCYHPTSRPRPRPFQNHRRRLLESALATTVLLLLPNPARAGLLEDYGTDPKKILDDRRRGDSFTATNKKGDKAIDPTLRASYYYPTAKKRYLPRIQKVSQEIDTIPERIARADWTAVSEFRVTAENAILPLQLYQSSLDGQGLHMTNSYMKQMKADAIQFEKAVHLLKKSIASRNGEGALVAVMDMGVAVADYRQQGHLSDEDDGTMPSVDEMRRMAMRNPTMKFVPKP